MTEEQPRTILCEIINRHGTDLCDDVDYFETLLNENCGEQYKREVFILTNALHENVVADLLNPSPNLKLTALLSHLTQRLHNNLGFDKTLAEWAVQTWAIALNKITQEPKTPIRKTDELEFTKEFSQAFELMEKNHPCVFITGKAGTGKSTLLDYFKRNTQKKIAVLAPTGVAALNVGGVTLHSFFRLAPRPIHPDELKPVRAKKRRKLYQSFDIIVIDEISMVRADMMDVIDRFMRLNGRQANQPFGGVQMIFIGDLFQLPPVVSSDEEAKLFSSTYQSPFFFSAKVFDEMDMAFVELTKVYRQKEQTFLDLLNTIRNNQAGPKDIEAINQRYQPQFEADINDYYITLTTTNQLAAQINTAHLEKLSTRLHQFEGEIKGKFEQSTLPTESTLSLKEGAQIMFVKNDSDWRWVNGTLGRIKKIKRDEIQVETSTKQIFTVKKVKWEILTYQFDDKTQTVSTDVIGSFTQYPLKLAWAMTIHKSQGKQFDRVIIDLGWGAFAHGQLYVALSRCKTLDGLILKKPVRPKDVIVDNRVIDFGMRLTQPQTSSMPPPF
jgi:ATP-dependent DNA helicase PIF1